MGMDRTHHGDGHHGDAAVLLHTLCLLSLWYTLCYGRYKLPKGGDEVGGQDMQSQGIQSQLLVHASSCTVVHAAMAAALW